MTRAPLLHHWQIDESFGAPVVRGVLADGTAVTRELLWWSHGYFGTENRPLVNAKDRRGQYKIGEPHRDPYPMLPARAS